MPFCWSEKTEDALRYLVEGRLTKKAICQVLGISTSTLKSWTENPEFAGRLDEELRVYHDETHSLGIASREHRLEAQNRRHRAIQQIQDERAEFYRQYFPDVPGGSTGLLTVTYKPLGKKKVYDRKKKTWNEVMEYVPEHSFDVALCKEQRELEAMASKEMGQTVQRMEVEYTDNRVADSLERKLTALAERIRERGLPQIAHAPGETAPIVQMGVLGAPEPIAPGREVDRLARYGGARIRQDADGSAVDSEAG